jgi:hypothetical protein
MLGAILFHWRWGNKRIDAGCCLVPGGLVTISGILPVECPHGRTLDVCPMAGFGGPWRKLFTLFAGACTRGALPAGGGCTLPGFIGMNARRNLDLAGQCQLCLGNHSGRFGTALVFSFNLAVTYEDLEKLTRGPGGHYERYLDIRHAAARKNGRGPRGPRRMKLRRGCRGQGIDAPSGILRRR